MIYDECKKCVTCKDCINEQEEERKKSRQEALLRIKEYEKQYGMSSKDMEKLYKNPCKCPKWGGEYSEWLMDYCLVTAIE